MAKNNMKSIRMTDEVLKYVDGFVGNGFNEKFENFVLFCLKEEKVIKERIMEQKKTCEANEKRIGLQRQIIAKLESISNSVNSLLDMSKTAEVAAKGVQLKMQEGEEADNVTQKPSSKSSAKKRSELQKNTPVIIIGGNDDDYDICDDCVYNDNLFKGEPCSKCIDGDMGAWIEEPDNVTQKPSSRSSPADEIELQEEDVNGLACCQNCYWYEANGKTGKYTCMISEREIEWCSKPCEEYDYIEEFEDDFILEPA
jgi:hypothetical protein